MSKRLSRGPEKGTSPIIWLAAIICAFISIVVIVAGIVVFVGYLAIHPRVPFLTVTNAHLEHVQNTQAGVLEVVLTIDIKAENDNKRALARFSRTAFDLFYIGIPIAKLRADPFEVNKNDSIILHYVVQSFQIPLDPRRMDEVDGSLKLDRIMFDLKGSSRARWKVGPLGSVKFYCHLSCELKFRPSNGTHVNPGCTTKYK